jgi:hypothetical protein
MLCQKKITLGFETLTLQIKNTCIKNFKTIYLKKFKNKKREKTKGKHFSM